MALTHLVISQVLLLLLPHCFLFLIAWVRKEGMDMTPSTLVMTTARSALTLHLQ